MLRSSFGSHSALIPGPDARKVHGFFPLGSRPARLLLFRLPSPAHGTTLAFRPINHMSIPDLRIPRPACDVGGGGTLLQRSGGRTAASSRFGGRRVREVNPGTAR